MILVIRRYDDSPDTDPEKSRKWGEKMAALLKQAPGFIDVQVGHRIAGSRQITSIVQWESLGAWTQFIESESLATVWREAPTFVNVEVEVYRVR